MPPTYLNNDGAASDGESAAPERNSTKAKPASWVEQNRQAIESARASAQASLDLVKKTIAQTRTSMQQSAAATEATQSALSKGMQAAQASIEAAMRSIDQTLTTTLQTLQNANAKTTVDIGTPATSTESSSPAMSSVTDQTTTETRDNQG